MKSVENIAQTKDRSLYQSHEEYVRYLEMTVTVLQREIEHLRSSISPSSTDINGLFHSNTSFDSEELISKFSSCSTLEEVSSNLHEALSADLKLFESKVYFFSSEKKLLELVSSDTTLNEVIRSFEESGLTDWVIENRLSRILPDLSQVDNSAFYLVTPIFLRAKPHGIFFARTALEYASEELLLKAERIADIAAISMDNLRSSIEIRNMNEKLKAMNLQILNASRFASLGELAGSFSQEIDSPLQIIKTNLALIKSGLGDTARRFEIVEDAISKISNINAKLEALSSDYSKQKQESIDLFELIEEILLFINSRLIQDDIRVKKEFAPDKIFVYGYKSMLKQAILNLLMLIRDTLTDGGTLGISIHLIPGNKGLISFSDSSRGLNQDELNQIFEPGFSINKKSRSFRSNLFLTKNIIKQHKGSISVISELDKGTTYKLVLPVMK